MTKCTQLLPPQARVLPLPILMMSSVSMDPSPPSGPPLFILASEAPPIQHPFSHMTLNHFKFPQVSSLYDPLSSDSTPHPPQPFLLHPPCWTALSVIPQSKPPFNHPQILTLNTFDPPFPSFNTLNPIFSHPATSTPFSFIHLL